jgi:hypothetical protein
MIIRVPFAGQLLCAPELAILASLETSLATSIQVLLAAHPELLDVHDPGDLPLDVEAAARLCRQAERLMATVARYRAVAVDAAAWLPSPLSPPWSPDKD